MEERIEEAKDGGGREEEEKRIHVGKEKNDGRRGRARRGRGGSIGDGEKRMRLNALEGRGKRSGICIA